MVKSGGRKTPSGGTEGTSTPQNSALGTQRIDGTARPNQTSRADDDHDDDDDDVPAGGAAR